MDGVSVSASVQAARELSKPHRFYQVLLFYLVINHNATNSGTFTMVISSYFANGTGTYRLSHNGLSDGLKVCIPKISGTSFNLVGVGGNPNTTYVLLTTTNVTIPAGMWTPILTNQFDQFGVFDYATVYNPAERERYFLLRQQ